MLIRIPLQRSGKDFTIMKVLPSGVYHYRFIVDGKWRYSPDLPLDQDDVGNAYNILDLHVSFLFFFSISYFQYFEFTCVPLVLDKYNGHILWLSHQNSTRVQIHLNLNYEDSIHYSFMLQSF